MASGASADEGRETGGVSSLELFFDLVFVFTITQLTGVLSHEPSLKGVVQAALMLGIIFWMYGGYAWLTNAVSVDRLLHRLLLLGGMAGFLAIALAVPQAFHGAGLTFGIAFLGVTVIHFGMFARSTQLTVVQAMTGLVPFNLITATMVLAGGILGGTAQYVLWALAFAGMWAAGRMVSSEGFEIEGDHFVERHGLIVIVAIGESVVAVGIGASGLPVSFGLLLAAWFGLALSAGLWWSYFGSDEEEEAKRLMAALPPRDRPPAALEGYGYFHLLILGGIIAIASALKAATEHPFDDLEVAKAIFLGGGAAIFLFGEALFRRRLSMRSAGIRAVAGVAALATIPVGVSVSAVAQVGCVAVLLAGMIYTEWRLNRERVTRA